MCWILFGKDSFNGYYSHIIQLFVVVEEASTIFKRFDLFLEKLKLLGWNLRIFTLIEGHNMFYLILTNYEYSQSYFVDCSIQLCSIGEIR